MTSEIINVIDYHNTPFRLNVNKDVTVFLNNKAYFISVDLSNIYRWDCNELDLIADSGYYYGTLKL